MLLHCYCIIVTYSYIIHNYVCIITVFVITLLLHHYDVLLHHYYIIITSLLLHYSQLQKQVILSSLFFIMHYPCFHYYIVNTHYYHHYPLLHVTNWATCRWTRPQQPGPSSSCHWPSGTAAVARPGPGYESESRSDLRGEPASEAGH